MNRLAVVVIGAVAGVSMLVLVPAFGAEDQPATSKSNVLDIGARGPRPDVLAERTFRKLAAAAREAPPGSPDWSRGKLRVLSKRVWGEGVWRLAYLETSTWICWALLVPRVTQEGSCGRRAAVRRRPLIVYTGSNPSSVSPGRPSDFVVYGLISPRVRSLRLLFSNCMEAPVSLRNRPLFWALVRRTNIVTSGYVAVLRGGRVLRGELLANQRSCRA